MDQEDQLSDEDHPTKAECYIVFVHYILLLFVATIKTLEKSDLVFIEIYEIMSSLREKLRKRKNDLYFVFNTNQGLLHLPSSQKVLFQGEAINVYNRAIEYLEKWLDFNNTRYLNR